MPEFSPFVCMHVYNSMTLGYLCRFKAKPLKMRQLIVVLGTFILYSFSANSQKLSGIVKDEQGKGLDKTTISLLRTKDSSVIKFSTTGNDGKFSIEAAQDAT